jgi:hypothetical protein
VDGGICLAVSEIEFSPPAHVKQRHRFVSCNAEHSKVDFFWTHVLLVAS